MCCGACRCTAGGGRTERQMDPLVIIKVLNVGVLTLTGGALYVFWRSSDRKAFLLHWSVYEFALAAAVIVDGHLLPTALAVGIAVPVLVLGVLGYRQDRPTPRYAFALLRSEEHTSE